MVLGPKDVAVDAAGNLYIAEEGWSRILKVDGNRTLSTFAGTRNRADYGGDGPAGGQNALFNSPQGIAVDANGRVYVGDTKNHRIRALSSVADGIRGDTVAGFGIARFSGDYGPAALAKLSAPTGVAVDHRASALFIADWGNRRLRRVDLQTATRTISTVEWDGPDPLNPLRLKWANHVAVDKDDARIYIADSDASQVFEVIPSKRKIVSLAGPASPGIVTRFRPAGIAYGEVAGERVLFASSCPGHAVYSIMLPGSPQGGGGRGFDPTGHDRLAVGAKMSYPHGLALDSAGRNLYIASTAANVVRKLDLDRGRITTVAGTGQLGFSGDGGPATRARLNSPIALAFDRDGNLFVADMYNHRIRMIDFSVAPL